MREEMKHVLQKIIDNDERGDKAKQEMTRVVAQHRGALTKLREQERLTFMQEEGARVSENTCSRAIYVLHRWLFPSVLFSVLFTLSRQRSRN